MIVKTNQNYQMREEDNEVEGKQVDDPQVVVKAEPKSTETQAFFNFMKSIFGIGVIAIPYASQKTGYLWTAPLLVLVAYACYRSTVFLLQVADELMANYSLLADVARITLSRGWANFVDVLIIANQVAHCIAYIIFFTTFLQYSLNNVGIEVHILQLYLVALIVLIPLTLISNIHFFHSTSLVGMVLSVLGVMITLIYGWLQIFTTDAEIHTEEPVKILNTFAFIGVGINCFDGIPTALPIRNTLYQRSAFQKVFDRVMIAQFIAVLLTQQLCVLAYGSDLEPIMMFSIKDPWWQFAAAVCYLVSILLTYPVKIYPAIEIIESSITNKTYSEFRDSELIPRDINEYPMWATDCTTLTIRFSLTVVIFVSAYVVPNFSAFLNLVGSVVGTLLVSFPCLMHAVFFKNRLKGRDIFDYLLIVTFCAITMVLGVYDSIVDMIEGNESIG